MFGGSVRDRIKAAEAAQDGAKANTSSNPRRGQKLALNTDEHIKEEVLRRGDGGWSKKVGIGQQEAYVAPIPVPFIKVTLDTPVVESKAPKLPGKLPGHFASVSEETEVDQSSTPLQGHSKKPQSGSQRSPPVIVEPPKATIDPNKREVEPEYAENSLKSRSRKQSRRGSSKNRKATVEDHVDSHDELHSDEAIDFSDVDWSGSQAGSKSPSKRGTRRSSRRERPLLEEIVPGKEASRNRSRVSRSKSAQRDHSSSRSKSTHPDNHQDHDLDSSASPNVRKSSRSGSTHRHASDSHPSPPSSARRSSHTLWPSFSQSERRSVGDILETSSIRSKSPRPRASSTHSATSIRTDNTSASKTIGIAEYISGQKLEHVASAPLGPPIPARPLGFVRSKSSSGEYSEYYTRNKHILRKPDDDEVFDSIDDHHKVRLEHRNSHGGSSQERRKSDSTPWQVKLMHGIAKH